MSELGGRVREGEEEVSRLRRERDELREMTEKSSMELRKALEVSFDIMYMYMTRDPVAHCMVRVSD